MASSVEGARAAFAERRWADALATFAAAGPLEAVDLERQAVCAYLVGEDDVCARAWEAAHRAALEAGDAGVSARCAFWLAFCLMMRGQMAPARHPRSFCGKYINLTPMGPLVAQAPEPAQSAMERQVVDGWQPYVVGGATLVDQPMVVATARK
jgi:hypothetical protein